jgi:SAM-dependent MidA family methyltransferase
MNLTTPKLTSEVLEAFEHALGNRASMPLDEFVQWALYHPKVGYYQKEKKRVGKGAENDFYTSTSLGSLWGELIVASSLNLLTKQDAQNYTFVEIAAEPSSSILENVEHPYRDHLIIRLGDPIQIPERSIVYSNEWLDAQPFKKFRFDGKHSQWKEIFVGVKENRLLEIAKDLSGSFGCPLPKNAADGYEIDWPTGSIKSIHSLLNQNSWSGLFLTFDYGLNSKAILKDRPSGTARAYKNQKMSSEILAYPTDQDITCHLCWDILEDALDRYGFTEITLQTQESFLIKNAQKKIQHIFNHNSPLNPRMLALRELIHPAHLGHGLQALSALKL